MSNTKYFVSYSREDSQFVLPFIKQLKILGAELWLDQVDIEAGKHWDKAIEEALSNCGGMIVILSPSSANSDNVLDEVAFAIERQIVIIPVIIKDTKIPFRLKRYEHIDFSQQYSDSLSKLLRALEVEQQRSVEKVCVSYHDDKVSNYLSGLIQASTSNFTMYTQSVEIVKGSSLNEERKGHLDTCDALVSIISRESYEVNANLIKAEIEHFDSKGKRIFLFFIGDAIRDESLTHFSGNQSLPKFPVHHYRPKSKDEPVTTVLKFSQYLSLWKYESGRVVQVLLASEEVSNIVIQKYGDVKVQYRLWRDGKKSGWIDTQVVPQVGGVYIYVKGVFNDTCLEVKMDVGKSIWKSMVTPQNMFVNLHKEPF